MVLDLRVGLVYTTSIASVIFTSTRMTATPATAGAATPSYCSSFLYDSGSDNQANRGTPPWCQHQGQKHSKHDSPFQGLNQL